MPIFRVATCLLAALVLAGTAAYAQQAGNTVMQRSDKNEDVYLAGGAVYGFAKIGGDMVAAGGMVTIENEITGDVLAAGGNVAVRARVGDDVRVAGGNVMISGTVGDDVIAAGGSVMLAPSAAVRGRAWLAGGNIEIHGNVGKGLRAAGRRVVIGGHVRGDADIAAEEIEIRPGAVIDGNLRYRSPAEAKIDNGAKIAGTVTRDESIADRERGVTAAARIGLFASLLLTAIVLYLLFPRASTEAARAIDASPWRSLTIGVAFLVGVPLAVMLLFVTLLGAWLALTVLALYLVLWLLGFLTGTFYVGDVGLRLIGKRSDISKGRRVLSLVAAFVALWIVCLVPVLGGLTMLAVLVLGLGGLLRGMSRHYMATR